MKNATAKRSLKAVILGLLFYIAIPTIDDAFNIPLLSLLLGLPIYIVIFIYYGTAWLLIFLIEMFVK